VDGHGLLAVAGGLQGVPELVSHDGYLPLECRDKQMLTGQFMHILCLSAEGKITVAKLEKIG
jgi:hypothetical protein